MGLLVVEVQIRTLFRVAVGVVPMLLADANMSYLGAKLPYNLHLGIPQLYHAVLDAEGPLAAEVLIIVSDAKGLALCDTLVIVVLVAPSTDGVADARKSDILHWNDPILVCRGLVGAAGAAKTASGILGAKCRREEEGQGGCQLHHGGICA